MKSWSVVTFAFMLTCVAHAQPNLVIRAEQMLDVETGKMVKDPVIVVRAGKFVEVGPASAVEIPKDSEIVDLEGATIMPGLIDAHVHMAWGPPQGNELPGKDEARATLLAGFTTVRNLGSTGMADIALRTAVEKGETLGPRMLASGPALGSKGGVCDQVFAGEAVVGSPDEAVKKVRELIERGADVIKFCAGGKVIPNQQDEALIELSSSIMRAIVEEAHKNKRKVAAHAQGPAAIRAAVEAGVDSIEHGGFINAEVASLMKQKHVYLVPTLYRLSWILESAGKNGADQKKIETLKANMNEIRKRIRIAIAAGVPIAFGTDATIFPHGSNAHEFVELTQAGLTPLEAIRSATIEAAKLLGLNDKIGAIKPGMLADLIAVKGNPLQDIALLQKVHFVMKDGINMLYTDAGVEACAP